MKDWIKVLLISLGVAIVSIIILAIFDILFFAPILYIALFVCGLIIYFIPTFVARDNNHINKKAIELLNFLVGWTFIGWVICIVWATSKPKSTTIINSTTNTSNKYEDLERLAKLKEQGTITEEEYKIEKEKLLK